MNNNNKIFDLAKAHGKLSQEGIIQDLINSIALDSANLEYIAKTGEINGSLLSELRRVLMEALTSKEEGNSIKECEHRHKVWVTQIAEMYCPECREITN